LRVEGFSAATGNVQGVSGGNLVAQMKDLKTDVDPTQFELPQDYRQITPEEVKQQMAQLTQLLQAAISFVNQQQQKNAAPAASPTATP
jgi:ABC-type transporter lipoprotein component MlaA